MKETHWARYIGVPLIGARKNVTKETAVNLLDTALGRKMEHAIFVTRNLLDPKKQKRGMMDVSVFLDNVKMVYNYMCIFIQY